MTAAWDVLFTNVHLATMVGGYGEIRDGAIAVQDGRIAWLGARAIPPRWLEVLAMRSDIEEYAGKLLKRAEP